MDGFHPVSGSQAASTAWVPVEAVNQVEFPSRSRARGGCNTTEYKRVYCEDCVSIPSPGARPVQRSLVMRSRRRLQRFHPVAGSEAVATLVEVLLVLLIRVFPSRRREPGSCTARNAECV